MGPSASLPAYTLNALLASQRVLSFKLRDHHLPENPSNIKAMCRSIEERFAQAMDLPTTQVGIV